MGPGGGNRTPLVRSITEPPQTIGRILLKNIAQTLNNFKVAAKG